MHNMLHLLGIARKAGRLEAGEEPVAAAARSRQAKLIAVASDAAENSVRRASHFAQGGNVPWVRVPFGKAELGAAVGRSSCAMLALTDVGLAGAFADKLAALDPVRYAALRETLSVQAQKRLQRQREQRSHEKNLQRGKRKPWAPPAAPKPARSAQREHPPEAAKRKRRPQPPSKRPGPRGIVTIKKKAP